MNHSFKTFAGLLLGAVAIVGCQREPQVEPNPNFNPETDEVNAAFVLSISTGSSGKTKMSADNVQKNPNKFLGMTDAKLMLYQTGLQSPYKPFVRSTDGSAHKETYDLGTVFTSGAINPSKNDTESSNRVLQLSLPLGADAALFYGKAINDSPGKVQGMTEIHLENNPANTYFGAKRRIGDEDNVAKYDATARLMIYAINYIIGSSVGAQDNYSVNGYTCKAGVPELFWSSLGHQWEVNNTSSGGNPYGRSGTVTTQSELAKSMGQAYALFTHLKTVSYDPTNPGKIDNKDLKEYRAGSSASVKAMMQDLYSVLLHTSEAIPLNDNEANVIRLANKAIDNMNLFFNSNWAYKDIEVIHTNLVTTYSIISESAWSNTTTGFAKATNLNNYPYITFGIPEGAAQLTFNPVDDTFSYTHPNKALVTPGREFEPRKYVYPAELIYYVNSPLRVTSSNISTSSFPDGTGPWNDESATGKWKAGNWSIGKVESSTRGVAIRDNINFGVALLETNVAYSGTSFDDNRQAMTGEDNVTFALSDMKLELRGVLIGGVNPRFNWQLIPRALTETESAAVNPGTSIKKYGTFDGVIYDDAIPSTAIPTATPNYTLVYDNYDYTKADNVTQNDVYVALEFVNNGDAFWGRDNLIPKGGVFYLGAKLTVAPNKLEEGHTDDPQDIVWPTDHQIPPIYESGDNAGKSKQIPRVFIQDFLTKATFRIGQKSLQYAYYSVPDLATSQMSFGLSVDLSWESGYEYDLVFGNNPGPTN